MNGFVFGYQSDREKIEDKLYDGFQDWVEKKFKISHSHNWHNTILFMSFCDEHKAFERTKELWKEYKHEIDK